jgi:hypothetical protein
MVYDSMHGVTVLFGGNIYLVGNQQDTWIWDGSSWTQVANTGPAPRLQHAMAFDSQRSKVVLFGGVTYSNAMETVWEWDGQAWSQTPQSIISPGDRSAHAMAYDSRRACTVLFGGIVGFNTLDDTWDWTSLVYGTGCGAPALTLVPDPGAPPRINHTAQAALGNIPSASAFVALGLSRAVFGGIPLPMSLGGLGMPGCDLLQSAEALAWPVTQTGPGTATFSASVPNLTALVGMHLYLQAWAIAPGANAANAIVSNGVDWLITA